MDVNEQKKQAAISALIKIAIWEGVVLIAVVASYFMTGSMWVLMAGLFASMALFAPMFLNWFKEHKDALSNDTRGQRQ